MQRISKYKRLLFLFNFFRHLLLTLAFYIFILLTVPNILDIRNYSYLIVVTLVVLFLVKVNMRHTFICEEKHNRLVCNFLNS